MSMNLTESEKSWLDEHKFIPPKPESIGTAFESKFPFENEVMSNLVSLKKEGETWICFSVSPEYDWSIRSIFTGKENPGIGKGLTPKKAYINFIKNQVVLNNKANKFVGGMTPLFVGWDKVERALAALNIKDDYRTYELAEAYEKINIFLKGILAIELFNSEDEKSFVSFEQLKYCSLERLKEFYKTLGDYIEYCENEDEFVQSDLES